MGDIWGAGLQRILRAPQILQPWGRGVRKSSSSGLRSLRAGTRGSHSSTVHLPRWAFHQNIDARSSKRANTRAFRLPFPRGTSCPSALRGWGDAGSVRGHLVTPQAPSPAGTWRGHAFNSNNSPPCCCTRLFAASTEAAGRWQARDAGRARTNPAVNHQNPSLPTRTPNPSWGLGTCSPPALPATTGMSRYRPRTVFSFFFFYISCE